MSRNFLEVRGLRRDRSPDRVENFPGGAASAFAQRHRERRPEAELRHRQQDLGRLQHQRH